MKNLFVVPMFAALVLVACDGGDLTSILGDGGASGDAIVRSDARAASDALAERPDALLDAIRVDVQVASDATAARQDALFDVAKADIVMPDVQTPASVKCDIPFSAFDPQGRSSPRPIVVAKGYRTMTGTIACASTASMPLRCDRPQDNFFMGGVVMSENPSFQSCCVLTEPSADGTVSFVELRCAPNLVLMPVSSWLLYLQLNIALCSPSGNFVGWNCR